MAHVALAMSETKASEARTDQAGIDVAVGAVKAKADEFARLPVAEKAGLLRACIQPLLDNMDEWVRLGCKAKGLSPDEAPGAEEWFLGPAIVMRHLKLLIDSLEAIDRAGAPPLGRAVRVRPDGRLAIEVMPTSLLDQVLFTGISAECLMMPGITEAEARAKQASFYKEKNPKGRVSLVLGAGNVAFLTPGDFLTEMFNDGYVCVVKMNPVNEYLGPIFERVFAPLVQRNYLRFVYGGGDVGAYLCAHPSVDKIHMTGSERVHDLIVWGPPGAERERRKAAKEPQTAKHVTSELGCVTPVIVPPAKYSAGELQWHARNVTTQLANNGSFMCVAAKMLVLSKGWAQKDAFLAALRTELKGEPLRRAYYPGAHDRFAKLTEGRKTEKIGTPAEGELPWTLVWDVDPRNKDEALFQTEPFCSILSVVELDETDPARFLGAAVQFANDTLWGTLTANLIVHPSLERDAGFAAALDQAILDLRYGTVAINQWSGVACGLGSTPWGGHPSTSIEDVQSGIGWVHNTYMLEGIEKCVLRSPFIVRPKPVWFTDHQTGLQVGPKLTRLVADGSWLRVPSLLVSAVRG